MEIQEIVQLMGSLVNMVGVPLLGVFMFYKYKREKVALEVKKAEADNITAYASEWKSLYEKKEQKVTDLNVKIDSLYEKIETLRKTIHDLTEKNTELMVKNSALEFRKCNKHGCPDREPPSDF